MAYIPSPNEMIVKEGEFKLVCGVWEGQHFIPHFDLTAASPFSVLRTFLKDLDAGEIESRGIELPIEAIRAIVEAFDEQR